MASSWPFLRCAAYQRAISSTFRTRQNSSFSLACLASLMCFGSPSHRGCTTAVETTALAAESCKGEFCRGSVCRTVAAEVSEAVQGFVLSAFANLLTNRLFSADFAVRRTRSECVLMPLSDLIHQVPRMLELMPSECLAALIATSRTHRSQIHNYVISITISDPTHASDLISCSWPQLVKWTLADQESHRIHIIRVTCDMTVAAASVLAKASMLSRWQLQLEGIELSAAVAAEIAKGDWPTLVRLYFWRAELTRAVVQELVAANRPALTYLVTLEMPVDIGIMSLLSQARWPQLAHMSLLNARLLSTQERKELEVVCLHGMSIFLSEESNIWSRTTPSSSSATIDWSSIIALNLSGQQVDTQMVTKLLHTGVNQIEILVLHCVQLDAAVILQLTTSECPRLRKLLLWKTGVSSAPILYLAQGKWPLLETLNLQGNELEDTALGELFKGAWPLLEELKLTVRSLLGKSITK